MTQISGKKYQMKNAAGTENRFPYTVMDAVYGLNSYLQDQFSALADIYMPIEGITESKTGQEFVYRQSPATIKAKSLTLNRIYGKTLAWNQGAPAVSVTNTVTDTKSKLALACRWVVGSQYPGGGISNTLGKNSMILTAPTGATAIWVKHNGSVTDIDIIPRNTPAVAEHKYYLCYTVISADPTTVGGLIINSIQLVDLTLYYGSEIDGLTDEQILAKFESEFPGYHDFGNKLISNDASAIETVGFNKWDEELLFNKGLNSSGLVVTANGYQTTSVIPLISSVDYYFKAPQNSSYQAFYDADMNCIYAGAGYGTANSVKSYPVGARYMRLQFTGYGSTYNHDICINLSDPAKNGTYEPYRKTTMQLNLGSFQVRDSQGNITTITGGLKSAGSVRDEIVGNKLVKRVGSVDLGTLNWQVQSGYTDAFQSIENNLGRTSNAICSKYSIKVGGGYLADKECLLYDRVYIKDSTYNNQTAATFKTAMSGVMLYYELATPIEYELVEPLVYSMAAGTTEERISTNSDGLSAPFCCDMTYDANANNDSANAQYAATAGRLYNTHKLWGQDFDGSNDVSGALSGVTTIEASGNITTVAQLISTVATGTAPLSVASTTEVANLHSYTATKLHNQRTLWGQNFDGSGNVTGDMSSVGNIAFSASGKNIASLLYFDTTNSRVGVGASSPAYKLDVNGTLNASGNTTLRGKLDVAENTAIGGTFTVGTSSVNKATTLYGALTASGAVSFTSTLGVTGLSTLAGGIKLTTTKKIWFGDTYFIGLDANNHLYTNAGFYSTSFITAGAVGSVSGGGGSNLVKERAYDISLTQIASSDYAELIRSPYISDSESGFMFAYSPAFLDTASQMHDYVIDAIGHEIGSCDIQWIGIAIGSTYTDVGVFDSGAFLVLAKSGNTYYWYEFEV